MDTSYFLTDKDGKWYVNPLYESDSSAYASNANESAPEAEWLSGSEISSLDSAVGSEVEFSEPADADEDGSIQTILPEERETNTVRPGTSRDVCGLEQPYNKKTVGPELPKQSNGEEHGKEEGIPPRIKEIQEILRERKAFTWKNKNNTIQATLQENGEIAWTQSKQNSVLWVKDPETNS